MNPASELNDEVLQRLNKEYFIWLTTVGSDLTPQPRPVWFVWEDNSFLVFSQPHAHKVRHIAQHPRVALHFNADETGDNNILVFTGTAAIDHQVQPAHNLPAYFKKYGAGIAGLGMTPAEFSADYSVAIRITPTSWRSA